MLNPAASSVLEACAKDMPATLGTSLSEEVSCSVV